MVTTARLGLLLPQTHRLSNNPIFYWAGVIGQIETEIADYFEQWLVIAEEPFKTVHGRHHRNILPFSGSFIAP